MNQALWHPVRWWRWHRARRHSASDWPQPDLAVSEAALLAVDLEMTGLDPALDEIVSIGWVPIDGGAIDLAGAQGHRLSRHRTETVGSSAIIHGLRDCDLADAGPPGTALRALLAALEGRVAVFHHAGLDLAFLERALDQWLGERWRAPVIDTLRWHRRRLRLSGSDDSSMGRGAATLEAAGRRHDLVARGQHDALADALSCAELLLVLAAESRATLLDVALPPR